MSISIIGLIIASIVAGSLGEFGFDSTAFPDFDVEKFLGRWYEIAVIDNNTPPSPCEWFEVRQGDHGPDSFNEVYYTIHERLTSYQIHGTINNSKMNVTYPIHGKEYSMIYTIKTFNCEKNLMLVEEIHQRDSQLISRSNTASPEAIAAFELQAKAKGGNITYIDHSKCSYFVQ